MKIDKILIKNRKSHFKYSKMSDIIDVSDIKDKIKNGLAVNLSISRDIAGHYISKRTFDIEIINLLYEYKDCFNEEFSYVKKQFISKNFNDIVIYYLIELIIIVELNKNKKINKNEMLHYFKKIDYISKDYILDFEKHLLNKRIKNNFNKNNNFLIKNKSSYEFPCDIEKIRDIKIKEFVLKLNLPIVEIPYDKDRENIISFFKDLIMFKEKIKLKKWNFNLRIKKTKKENCGMYIVNANTIIIDPRTPESIYHEIGHYVYENNLSFTFKNKRIYRYMFKKIIERNKKRNIPNSEIFAIWFEEMFKNK